jgi:hypothetical protein
MNVEGAEYDLLQDFIVKDALKLIDYMAVFYHLGISSLKTPEDVFNSLINKQGVKSINWH